MKIVVDILIGLRQLQADTAAAHLRQMQSAESLMQLNGIYRGVGASIDYIEQVLRDEQDKD